LNSGRQNNKPKGKKGKNNNINNNNNSNSNRKGNNNSRSRKGAIAQNDSDTKLQHAPPVLDDIVEKDEYVSDILGSGGLAAANIQQFKFNPGNKVLFPLGSSEANKFTLWECISAEPYLLHEVSEYATDGSTGKIYLSMDYNAANGLATTKQQLADMHSASCMPCQDIGLKLRPKLLNRVGGKYIRNTALSINANQDIRLSDGGTLYVASIGQAGTTKISELRIRYKFRVQLPTLLNEDSVPTYSAARFSSTTAEGMGTTGTPVNLEMANETDNLSAIVVSSGTGNFTPVQGYYKIDLDAQIYNGSSDMTESSCDILKNGISIFPYSVTTAGFAATGNSETAQAHYHISGFVYCNGTDVITFPVQAEYTGGSQIALAQVIFVPL
jgi:hypothetical protein